MAPSGPVASILDGITFRCIAGGRRRCSEVSRSIYARPRNITEVGDQKSEIRKRCRMQIRSARDLIVYQKAYELAMEIFAVSKDFPVGEDGCRRQMSDVRSQRPVRRNRN